MILYILNIQKSFKQNQEECNFIIKFGITNSWNSRKKFYEQPHCFPIKHKHFIEFKTREDALYIEQRLKDFFKDKAIRGKEEYLENINFKTVKVKANEFSENLEINRFKGKEVRALKCITRRKNDRNVSKNSDIKVVDSEGNETIVSKFRTN